MRNAHLFVIACMTLIGVPRAHAQPKPVVVEKHHVVLARPTVEPPPPREEKITPRPGFIWLGGHWDWRDGKWAWLPGRWEKERAGKKWRPARWEKKDKEYVLVEGVWEDGGGATAVVVGLGGPTEAPPQPREERIAPRPGFVYLPGRWDWRNKKWEWMAGRWEKERAGKKWRPSRWELRGKEYALVEGDWEDGGATVGVVVGLGPLEPPPQPREERIAPRPGFVYLPGRWDWRNKKWEWMPGRWEKERAGKKWRPARWELRGKEYALVEGDWEDGAAVGVVVGLGPLEPPPQPREERIAPRPGFVYLPGRWDWRNKKWEWMPGRWEKERAGKKWRPSRWELRGKEYALVEGDWEDGAAVGVVVGLGPLEPPPQPREERIAPRPGFVYLPGRWDWRDKKWEWMPGRWEKERAHQKWRPARWELRDKQYALVEGDWVDEGIAVGEPPPPPFPPREHHHWTLDRPTVSSYWPLKGKTGSRIVIHGRNFPPDAMVVWNGEPVRGARVTPEEIVVVVPPSAASGDIAIRRPSGRDLYVGMFEVKADYDYEAEARRLEAERLARAQAEWAARQQQLAKDRAAREAALVKYEQDRAASREQRRAERIAAIQARWAKQQFLADADTQSELTLHAQRVAKLERMKELAEVDSNGKVAVRIDVALNKESDRHDQRMTALEAAFKAKGGAP